MSHRHGRTQTGMFGRFTMGSWVMRGCKVVFLRVICTHFRCLHRTFDEIMLLCFFVHGYQHTGLVTRLCHDLNKSRIVELLYSTVRTSLCALCSASIV